MDAQVEYGLFTTERIKLNDVRGYHVPRIGERVRVVSAPDLEGKRKNRHYRVVDVITDVQAGRGLKPTAILEEIVRE